MLSPLTNKVYARLFAAQVVALLGTGLTTVALALLAFDLAGGNAGVVLGIALTIKMVAYVILSPLAATIAQRVPRRTFLIALDLARAGVVACLPFVTEVWQIYVLIFLMQACSAGFTPTFQATIPDVLDDEAEYTKALSLSRLAYDLENLLSPMLAAAALLVMSSSALFGFNAIGFLISAALVLSVVFPPQRPTAQEGGFLDRALFGLRAYLATPRLRGLLALSMAVSAAGSMVIVNTVVYVRSHLGLGEPQTAILLMAFGAGSMVAALALPPILERVSDRSVMLGGAVVMVAALAFGMALPDLALVMVIWFIIGLGFSIVQLPAGRLLRRSSSQSDRPAFFAAQFSLSHACWLVCYPLAGWLGSRFGLTAAFAVLCLIAIAAIITASFVWPKDDREVLAHTHEAMEHDHLHIHDEHHQHDHEGWEGPEPHAHPHRHPKMRHSHGFVIDAHHPHWPR